MADLARTLTEELANCRQRGIERLDVRTHNQVPVSAPELERLARSYAAARKLTVLGRASQIKHLLWDALAAMELPNEADAVLVRDLFFGASPPVVEHGAFDHGSVRLGIVRESAGELLDQAYAKSGLSESRFKDRRTIAFSNFAAFLLRFCAPVMPAAPDAAPASSPPDGPEPAAERPSRDSPPVRAGAEHPGAPDDAGTGPAGPRPLRTGHVADGERFTQLLADAVNATIIGFTNENLASMLESALLRKRAALNDPDAFWGSIRIVFFSDKLLDSITDERPEYPDRREALRHRRLAAVYGRRSVTVLLRRIRADRWALYEAPFVPPFVGTLFELPTGRRVIHLLIRNPQRSAPDHLYVEVDETADQYFTAVFEDIVHNSISDNKTMPIGVTRGNTFQPTGSRFRHNVLRDGSGALGWLPYVLVVTYRRREGRAEPFLQMRSKVNAARELDRLTHLATRIFQDDYDNSDGSSVPPPPPTFDLEHQPPIRAARRRVYMEAGEDLPGELVPVATSQYLHHDREHLFFFVYSCEMPADFHFPRQAEMHHVTLPEVLAILENQALRKAELLFGARAMPNRIRAAATEIAALNLILHGQAEVGERLLATAGQRQPQLADLAVTVRQLIEQTRQPWFSAGREVDIQGLSGLHYREFFTLLLPLYAQIGVPGAAGHLALIRENEHLAAAIARLAELYLDEETIMAIPAEL